MNTTARFLEDVADGMLIFELNGRYRHAYMCDGMGGVRRLLDAEERREANRRFDAARRRGLISETRIGARSEAFLTDKGAEALNRVLMRTASLRDDSKHVYVIYDIPERHRASRDRLRSLLKQAGFTPHQQSVWRTDKDVAPLLKAWILRHRLESWVDVFEA